MTEKEKIELFDKWYDENYDEWAEGEEGIALREELEQAFKSGIAELEAENERLTVSYETLKLHDEEEIGMLKSENAELKRDKEDLIFIRNQNAKCMCEDKERFTKAKELLKKWVELYKPKLEGYPITPIQEQTEQFLNSEGK